MLLKDKVAVVTGGGRGIGRAIAKKFASEGASMVVTARSQKEIDEVSAEIRAAGGEASSVVADVSREEDCHKIVNSTRKAFGRIHILINNAGVLGRSKKPQHPSGTKLWRSTCAARLC
jgi:NAD(P)-dependent dehydrogenase (short-subunit alcohol dehydrogenase family)